MPPDNPWVKFIKDVGIPTAIAFYVLIRLEPAINSNTQAINNLTVIVSQLARNLP